jgi:hypothetical protein
MHAGFPLVRGGPAALDFGVRSGPPSHAVSSTGVTRSRRDRWADGPAPERLQSCGHAGLHDRRRGIFAYRPERSWPLDRWIGIGSKLWPAGVSPEGNGAPPGRTVGRYAGSLRTSSCRLLTDEATLDRHHDIHSRGIVGQSKHVSGKALIVTWKIGKP